jgi:hypothetical protein
MISVSTKCYWGDEVKKDEVGGVYSTYGIKEKRCIEFVFFCAESFRKTSIWKA